MTRKHRPITGFRIAKPAARHSRSMSENRLIRFSEIRQFISALVTSERCRDQVHDGLASAIEYGTRPAGKPAAPPQRKIFDVGQIDRSKSTLRVISMAEADARGRRETLMHFGQNPDL